MFKRRFTVVAAMRFVCTWCHVARPMPYMRVRNILTDETIEKLPYVVLWTPSGPSPTKEL